MEVTLCITLDSLVNLVNKCCPISCPLKGGGRTTYHNMKKYMLTDKKIKK